MFSHTTAVVVADCRYFLKGNREHLLRILLLQDQHMTQWHSDSMGSRIRSGRCTVYVFSSLMTSKMRYSTPLFVFLYETQSMACIHLQSTLSAMLDLAHKTKNLLCRSSVKPLPGSDSHTIYKGSTGADLQGCQRCMKILLLRLREEVAVHDFTFVLTDIECCQRFGFCRLSNSAQMCLCILRSKLPHDRTESLLACQSDSFL
ncbi:uncharacterized protein ACBT44_009405 isoform 2-T2 [Syngnathus typhle]